MFTKTDLAQNPKVGSLKDQQFLNTLYKMNWLCNFCLLVYVPLSLL